MSRSTVRRQHRALAVPPSVTASSLLINGSDLAFRELIQNLLAMGMLLHRLRGRLAAELNMSGPQYAVFLAIAHLQGEHGISASAVAQHLRVSAGLVTNEAGTLERAGLIAKCVNPADRRGVLLTLTESGISALIDFTPALQRINDSVFGELAPSEFRQLVHVARRIVDAADRTELLEQAHAVGNSQIPTRNQRMRNTQ